MHVHRAVVRPYRQEIGYSVRLRVKCCSNRKIQHPNIYFPPRYLRGSKFLARFRAGCCCRFDHLPPPPSQKLSAKLSAKLIENNFLRREYSLLGKRTVGCKSETTFADVIGRLISIPSTRVSICQLRQCCVKSFLLEDTSIAPLLERSLRINEDTYEPLGALSLSEFTRMYNTRRVVQLGVRSQCRVYLLLDQLQGSLWLPSTWNEKSRVVLFLFLSGSFLRFILELRRFFSLFGDRCSGDGAKKKRETRSGSSRRTLRWRSVVYIYLPTIYQGL